MNKLKHWWLRATEIICRRLSIIKIYQNHFGIKNINMYMVADIGSPRILQRMELQPDELFLGPDYLKDSFTLLGKCILESPHVEFMKSLLKEEILSDTEYAMRYSNGTLDWRRGYPVSSKIESWRQTFHLKKEIVLDGKQDPVRVYRNKGKYYIYDGKHRAALCAVLGIPIKCEEIEMNYIISFYNRYMFSRMNDKDYKIHKNFIEGIDIRWTYK